MPRKPSPEWLEARQNEWAGVYANSERAQHYMQVDKALYRQWSLNPIFPYWQQLAFHAYAQVKQGQTEYVPKKHNELRGFIGVAFPRDVQNEIDKAVLHGMLREGSTTERLIIPEGVSFMTPRK